MMRYKPIYAAVTAAIVKGKPIEANSLKLTGYPFFRSRPVAAILVDAPIGVILPPRVAPIKSPKRKSSGGALSITDIVPTTGSMVITYGTLSINADARTDPHMIIVYPKKMFPLDKFVIKCAMSLTIWMFTNPCTIINKPVRRSIVSQSISLTIFFTIKYFFTSIVLIMPMTRNVTHISPLIFLNGRNEAKISAPTKERARYPGNQSVTTVFSSR